MNVISFSLYGDDPKYTVGALENIKIQPEIYPGWICKFYVNKNVPSIVIDEIIKLGAIVKIINAPIDFKSKFVRMEIAVEPNVSRFIVRDCDSRLNKKEAVAVQEWINSGKSFHIMRDHKQHTSPIMGGMWGAVREFIPDTKFLELYREWITGVRKGKFKKRPYCKTNGESDQGFLAHKIYPLIKEDCLVHTSYKKFEETDIEFSTRLRYGRFVGQQFRADGTTIKPRS